MQLFVVFALCLVLVVNGKYFSVSDERCEVLSNATTMFDNLLPCARYTVDPLVELVCLTEAEIKAEMKKVPNWTLVVDSALGDSLKRSFAFSNFQNAFYFMTLSAQVGRKRTKK